MKRVTKADLELVIKRVNETLEYRGYTDRVGYSQGSSPEGWRGALTFGKGERIAYGSLRELRDAAHNFHSAIIMLNATSTQRILGR